MSVVTSYYRTKELIAEVHKKGEARHGPAIKYYKNGNIMEEAHTKITKKTGPIIYTMKMESLKLRKYLVKEFLSVSRNLTRRAT